MSEDRHQAARTQDAIVPMRDGVRLAADLYLPAEDDHPLPGPWPAILIRTPYNKEAAHHVGDTGPSWARHGYACLIQDCRGRYKSEGRFYKYVNEALDGYDTLEWMAAQGWCDGQIGTTGASYLCHVQTCMAALHPPHLKAMFCVKGGFYNAHTSGIRQGGAFEFRHIVWAWRQGSLSPEVQRDPAARKAFEGIDLSDWLKRGPLKRGYSPVSPAPAYEAYLFDQMEEGDYGAYWKQVGLNTEEYLDDYADVPTIYLSGWYDMYSRSAVEMFQNLAPAKSAPIKLVLGPWEHRDEGQVAGEVDFGQRAPLRGNVAPSRFHLERRWFDRWLKGIRNGAEDDPPVRYFTMGGGDGRRTPEGNMRHGGTWHTSSTWPPQQAQMVPFYLRSDASLSKMPPLEGEASHSYRYDPCDPVPSIGGNMNRYADVLWPGGFDQREREGFFLCQTPYLPLATRHDVLVFRTAPLEQAIEATGTVWAQLYVSSSAPDTDFTVKLIDEYPPSEDYPWGFALNLTQGIIRCRYRNSRERAELMQPGIIYPVEITCYPTSAYFGVGHRIRVDISSSNYPHYDINTNSGQPLGKGQHLLVAHNAVHHDQDHPSRILLPILA